MTLMDEKFQDILDTLPEKPPRSRLEPYREFINELLRRGRTYRDIASILAEKCQVRVSISTVHDFLRIRRQTSRKPTKSQLTVAARLNTDGVTPSAPPMNEPKEEKPANDEVQRQIAAFKQRPAPQDEASPKQFQYNPNEPLHLPAKTRQGQG
jgi:hypothetical protein